jgi:enoyl-CoA hydratase/carnithine racemase
VTAATLTPSPIGEEPVAEPQEPLVLERRATAEGAVAVLRMHRPEARNAMDTALLAALVDALADAADDDEVRGILLAGADGVFSAGADIREELPDGGVRRNELFGVFYESLSVHPKPTAAAVEGPAVGGGAEAAAACDVRFAGRSARFRFPGAIYGIPVGAARTVGLVGLGVAKDWVLSSREVEAAEARAAGFVQRIVDDGAAEAAALDWLTTVGARDREAVRRLKATLNAFSGLPDRVAWENDALRTHHEEGGALPRPGVDGVTPRRGGDGPTARSGAFGVSRSVRDT